MKALAEYLHYPIKPACELLGLARSSYYYSSRKTEDAEWEGDVEVVVNAYAQYGTRRVTYQLRRAPYHHHFNRKRIQRVMRKHGWLRPKKVWKCRTTNSRHAYPRYKNLVKDLVIGYPDQVWVADITYIRLGNGFVYLAIVLDVFTRTIRGWNMSLSLDQELSLAALRMALMDHVPQMHHSDQGIQYAAHAYIDLLRERHVQISMAAVGKAEENGYAERLMRTIKEEEVDLSDYQNLADARYQIGCFIQDVYNSKRIHSALGYLTPAEFEAVWLSSQLQSGTP